MYLSNQVSVEAWHGPHYHREWKPTHPHIWNKMQQRECLDMKTWSTDYVAHFLESAFHGTSRNQWPARRRRCGLSTLKRATSYTSCCRQARPARGRARRSHQHRSCGGRAEMTQMPRINQEFINGSASPSLINCTQKSEQMSRLIPYGSVLPDLSIAASHLSTT